MNPYQQRENEAEWFPYPRPKEWCDEAIVRIRALRALVQGQNTQKWLVEDPPQPEPVLRVTPEL